MALSTWVTVGKIASPAGSGPISLRAASIAAELAMSWKLPLAGSTNSGLPRTAPKLPRKPAVVPLSDQVGPVLPEQVVLRLAAELLAGRRWIAAVDELEKMLSIASQLT